MSVIDTGLSHYQSQLNTFFATGQSAGRTRRVANTRQTPNTPVAWHDDHGHGTGIIGLAAAPQDGRSLTGIAYRADVHAIRAIGDVVVYSNDVNADIITAVQLAGAEENIINLAFGSPYHYNSLEDAINNVIAMRWDQKVMFIGAAGTQNAVTNFFTYDRVVFPASLPNVIAVTGVVNGPVDRCRNCHSGGKVEFSAYTCTETTPVNDGDSLRLIGGSSGATASISGIAALLWGANPTWRRDDVLAAMRRGSVLTAKDPQMGWGAINAYKALGGLYAVSMAAPGETITSSGTYTWRLQRNGGTGPFTYQWSHGTPSGDEMSLYVDTSGQSYELTVQGCATDAFDGVQACTTSTVYVQGDEGGMCGPGLICMGD